MVFWSVRPIRVNPFTAKYLLVNKIFFNLVKYVRLYDYLECVGQSRHVLSYYSLLYRGCFL